LDALMLLTLADGMGTSDENWSDWKESLVWQLYRQTVEFLEEGPASFERKQQDLKELRHTIQSKLAKDFAPEIEAHLEQMPERYFQAFDSAQIREHLRLFRKFFQILQDPSANPLYPVVRWIDHAEQGHTEVWVCGWDRPALLERLAGSFVAAGMNILSADVFTRSDHAVIDIFRVCDLRHAPVGSQKDRRSFERTLEQALASPEFDLPSLFRRNEGMSFYRLSQELDMPTRVVIENRLHPKFTLVEIQTPDRPGLLYDLLRAFHEAGIAIELSRVTTEMDVALDTFYVTTPDGNKITDEEDIANLQQLLQQAAVE
jgi:[protein-PII] uridylyltransferase